MWHYVRALDTENADAYAAAFTPDGQFGSGGLLPGSWVVGYFQTIDERLQQENRKPLRSGCARLLRVQLHQDPPDATLHTCNGVWRD
jgi:hypothetical protein